MTQLDNFISKDYHELNGDEKNNVINTIKNCFSQYADFYGFKDASEVNVENYYTGMLNIFKIVFPNKKEDRSITNNNRYSIEGIYFSISKATDIVNNNVYCYTIQSQGIGYIIPYKSRSKEQIIGTNFEYNTDINELINKNIDKGLYNIFRQTD